MAGLGPGVAASLLTRDLHRRIQPVLMTLAPGARHANEVGHAGEEVVYLLAGTLVLRVDAMEVALAAGDTAYYPSALAHAYFNPGPLEAVLLTIGTPPKPV